MWLRQSVVSLFFLLFLNYSSNVTGSYYFDSDYDTRCITPNRQSGECKALHECPTIYNIFQIKVLDAEIKQYLQKATCNYTSRVPIVCCEKNAGSCITPDKRAGSCVPLKRCDTILDFLEEKPIFNENKISYIRKSECEFGNKDKVKVCCPFVKITPDILSRIKLDDEIKVTPVVTPVPTPPPTPAPTPPPTPEPAVEPKGATGPLLEPGDCGVEEFGSKIIGGELAGIYDFPWMALLQYTDNDLLGCGGTLINSRYVLTAAHCVIGPTVQRYGNLSKIRLGEYDTNSEIDCYNHTQECTDGALFADIDTIIPHIGFSFKNKDKSDDIALVRLKEEVEFTEFIRPICLPPPDVIIPQNLSVSGWGRTETAFQSNVKLKLQIPVFDKGDCSNLFFKSVNRIALGPGQICAGAESGKDSCTGDSGGPLMFPQAVPGVGHVWFQIGVTSFGPTPCGLKDRPGVYTLVSQYIPWIMQNIRP